MLQQFLRIWHRAVLTPVLICMLTAFGGASEKSNDGGQSITDVLRNFEQGDPGWTIRMKSLVHVMQVAPLPCLF